MPTAHYDEMVKDTVWVDSSCRLVVNPSYWGMQVNGQVTLNICEKEIEEKKKTDTAYAATLLDLNKGLVLKEQFITNKDLVISGKDSLIALYTKQIQADNTEKKTFQTDLDNARAAKANWVMATWILLGVAVVEGVVLYFIPKK